MARTYCQRILAALLVILFLLGLVLSSLVGGDEEIDQSVSSVQPSGRRALFLFLSELGFQPDAWNGAPIALPRGRHLLWIAREPWAPARAEEGLEAASESDAIWLDPRHPANYGQFVRRGGTLVMTGSEAHIKWLRESCELTLPSWIPCETSATNYKLELDTGESLSLCNAEVALSARESGDAQVAPYDPDDLERDGWHHFAVAEDGRPFASWCAMEDGRVLLLADDRFLDNDRLGMCDNGLLALRLIEFSERGGQLLFDEFALGAWVPPTKIDLLLQPGVFEVAYHALLAGLLLVLFHSWRREFPRDPAPMRLNPRQRVQSQARLLGRAGRYDLLAHELRLGSLRGLARSLGIPGSQRTLREGTSPELAAELAAAWSERLSQAHLRSAWRAAFDPRPMRREADLDQLRQELESLEKSIASHALAVETVRASP